MDYIDFDLIIHNLRRRYYHFLGSGSSRVVYDLGDGYVAKAAKNKKGIAQNKAEYIIGLSDDSGLFAKVLDVSDRFSVLIMEKANRVKDMSYVWKYFNVRNNQELYKTKELLYAAEKHDLQVRDFGRASNWGVISDRPVIIDFGFTMDVARKYYTPALGRLIIKKIIKLI